MSRSLPSTARPVVLAVPFLIAFLLCNSAFADEKGGAGNTLKELKEKRLVLLEKAREFALKGYQENATKFTPNQVHLALQALLAARLDLAQTREDRIKICEEAIKDAEAWEKIVIGRVKAGDESAIWNFKAQALVLETRITLEQIKAAR